MKSSGLITQDIRNTLYNTEIATLLETAESLIHETHPSNISRSDQESDSEVEIEASDNKTILDELAALTRNLIELNSALEHAVIDPEYVHEVPAMPNELSLAPHQFYSNCIREKFPQAAEELIEHLGKANLERYRYIQAQKESVDEEDEALVVQETATVHDRGASTFHDSGIGTSLQRSTCAPSVISSFASTEAGGSFNFKFPPIPEVAKSGEPFECDGCGRQVVMANQRAWRWVPVS